MAVMNFDEKEVAELITDPNTIIALSDAGAHANQIDAIGVTYGYAEPGELEAARPDYLVASVEALDVLLLKSDDS